MRCAGLLYDRCDEDEWFLVATVYVLCNVHVHSTHPKFALLVIDQHVAGR